MTEANVSTKAEHATLLRAAMQTGKTLAGGVTHDLNSALQILGDSLYAIKDDTRTLIRSAGASGEDQRNIASSLELADEAFDRIKAITRVVPNLIVGSGDEVGPIHVEAELRAIAALTHHHWKNRLSVVVDVSAPIPPFWCRWWIARLAAMRLVMLAGESQPFASAKRNAEPLPTLTITGAMEGPWFALGMCIEPSTGDFILPPTDSVMTLCANSLGGEIQSVGIATGGAFVSLRYPVRLAPTPFEAGAA
jgi:hypothetical protein